MTQLAAPNFIDYYDLLMISPTADRAMVAWSVRLMLRRYGPDNVESADAQKFSAVQQAYRTLADPAKRTEYDDEYQKQAGKPVVTGDADTLTAEHAPPKNPLEILKPPSFRSTVTREHVVAQQQMRQDIVSTLYETVMNRPRNPELGRAEIARAICCNNDELEFALWFLREQNLIRTTPTGAYSVTSHGVIWAEDGGVRNLSVGPDSESLAGEERDETLQPELTLVNDTVSLA